MTESVVALEAAERDACTDLFRAAGPDIVAATGLRVEPLGGAVLLTIPQVDVLAVNRVIGFGVERRPTASDWDVALAAIEATGAARVFVPLAPTAWQEETAARLAASGLRHHNNWVRLRRDLGAEWPEAPDAGLDVRQIGPRDAAEFGRIVAEAFQYPPAIAPLAGQSVGRPNWYHYLAYDGRTPVAAGAMYLAGEAAWFGFAATDSRFRRRGAQRALIVRRLADARERGARWVSVETAEDSVVRDAPSFRNLRRIGFEVAYTRPNYLWVRRAAALPTA